MCRHRRVRPITQFVLQGFGKGLHAGFRNIVGWIARRRGDALLRAGIDDQSGLATGHHGWREGLRSVNNAPQIDIEHPLPVIAVKRGTATAADGGIVHQYIDILQGRGQPEHLLAVTYVGFDAVKPVSGRLGFHAGLYGFHRGAHTFFTLVDNIDHHAKGCEAFRGGQANAGSASGDQRRIAGFEGRM